MIESIKQLSNHLVQFRLKPGGDYVAMQIQFSIDGLSWSPAPLYPDLDPDTTLNGSTFLWNQAQTEGTLRLRNKKDLECYWNPYLKLRTYVGLVQLKIGFITTCDFYEELHELSIEQTEILFLDDWDTYISQSADPDAVSANNKWDVIRATFGNAVGLKSPKSPPPLRIFLPVQGVYDIYFGIATGGLRCKIKLGDESYSRFEGNGSRYIAGPEGKYHTELYWQRKQLNPDWLEIAVTHRTTTGHHRFGWLAYIKLVPFKSDGETGSRSIYSRKCNHLTLYYEPYSYSIEGLHDAESMNSQMLEEFLQLQPREIACQTVRIGSKSLHHSNFLERFDQKARADDNSINDDFVILAQNCDILKETVQYAHKRNENTLVTACIGMNRPYLWNPTLSEKFIRENSSMIRGGDLDYTIPEVQAYALQIIEELIFQYDIDGLIFDYMRHYLNQTVDTLEETIGETRRMLNDKQKLDGKKRELKIRFPADQFHYYHAMKVCVAKRYIDALIPSNFVTTFPLPAVEPYVQLCRGTNVKVFGCIDGWVAVPDSDPRIGAAPMHHSPKDVAEAIDHYTERGVDGIFVYQADQFTANPYLKHVFSGQ